MIQDNFLAAIKEYYMIEPGELVLIAVSGGADSLALLHLLAECQKILGIKLHIAHLNHLIRKGDAETDMRFVQMIAQKLKLPITVESSDVTSFAKEERLGIEEAARRIRYAFYDRVANQVGAQKIAVGHNADDNVETFLMRILRGSGLKGLTGIPAKRGRIIRPLIKIWRKDIEQYINTLKIVPRQDYTNYESKFTRNRVRLKLIPQLKIYNLNIKEIILQTILLLTEDHNYLENKAEEALGEVFVSGNEAEIKLNIRLLQEWESPIQGHLLRQAIARVKGDLFNLSFQHIQEIIEKLNNREKWELHLPGNIFISGNRGELTISRQRPAISEKKEYFYQLAIPGEILITETNQRLRATLVQDETVAANSAVAYVDYHALGKQIIVRSKNEGDKFTPLGMKGSKKLQDFFVDEKIPAELRDQIPIVESAGRVVWVGGNRIDDRVKVTAKTKQIVKLELL
jgi:tRNA(Ile)-lysidine synthase